MQVMRERVEDSRYLKEVALEYSFILKQFGLCKYEEEGTEEDN